METSSKYWLITIVMASLLAGCGAPNAVEAPRRNIQAMPMRVFPKQNWLLNKAYIFLWKKNMSASDGYQAQAIGDRLDDLDWTSISLNRQHADLDSRISVYQQPLSQFTALQTTTTKQLNDTTKALQEAQAKLNAEKAKVPPSTELVAQYNAQVAALTDQLAKQKVVKEAVDKDVKQARDVLKPLQDQRTAIETQQMNNQTEYIQRINDIMALTDWYTNAPSSVFFEFRPDGTIGCKISEWGLSDDATPVTFSTDAPKGKKPTIGELTYTELGGVFDFNVYVYKDAAQKQLQDTFHFRLARVKYDSADGRSFFGGEITRTTQLPNGKIEVRYGMAKLVDKNN